MYICPLSREEIGIDILLKERKRKLSIRTLFSAYVCTFENKQESNKKEPSLKVIFSRHVSADFFLNCQKIAFLLVDIQILVDFYALT